MLKNDVYLFWNEYLDNTILKIKKLIKVKKNLYCDFHMHSEYSIDASQTLCEIIERAKKLKLDIISITDHDNVDFYDELYKYLQTNKIEKPIIVPGIEFTINNKDYGSQFHILQLMINPKSKEIMNNVKYQQAASWNRAYLQFERIKYNKALQYIIKKYKLNLSLENYKTYLKKCYKPIPEYATIMAYLNTLFLKKSISNWDILKQCEKWNETDKCIERKLVKKLKYNKLSDRYKNVDDSNINIRFLHSMIAVKGADDDFYDNYECMGDLSVNNYGQLRLEQLNKSNLTVFAHPTENKLNLLSNLKKLNNCIDGIELNKQNEYSNIEKFNNVKNKLNLFCIKGSDSHNIDSSWYDDMKFYLTSKENLNLFLDYLKKYRGQNEKN